MLTRKSELVTLFTNVSDAQVIDIIPEAKSARINPRSVSGYYSILNKI